MNWFQTAEAWQILLISITALVVIAGIVALYS